MKKLKFIAPLLLALTSLAGCNNDEPLGDQMGINPGAIITADSYNYDETCHWLKTDEEKKEQHSYVNGVCSICNAPYIESKGTSTFDELINSMVPPGFKEHPYYNLAMMLATSFQRDCIGEGTIKYERYSFHYTSQSFGEKSEPIELSGAFTIPFYEGKYVTNAVVISSHATFVDLKESPSNGFDIYTLPAILGTVVIECDLSGFGVAKDLPIDYHCKHSSPRHTVDGVLAANALLSKLFGIDISKLPTYNLGYSQGGYDSLALLKYMETEASKKEKDVIKITSTYSGSGAYDPGLMFEESIKNEKFEASQYLLMAIISGFNYHKNEMEGLKYEDILTEKGLELLSLVDKKNGENINNYIAENITGPIDVFVPELFEDNSELLKTIKNLGSNESLIDGSWNPEGELYLLYSPQDNLVTPKCTLAAEELWKNLPYFKTGQIGGIVGYDHASAAIDFYITTLGYIKDAIK